MNGCPLCDVVERGAPLELVRGHDAVALLHEDWAVRGHAMIVAARHVENASDLDPQELESFMRTVHRVERALLRVFDADRAVWMKLGLAVPHFHLHIYPVKRSASREDVFAAIDTKVRDEPEAAEKSRLVDELRSEVSRQSGR